ncbi:DUF1877 domain-containing protein [Streptomyces sp. Ru71]|uniref:DUF1877 family protein n=1 Tax=Streptomyces sp. Ru71 TaxID=2080746 RepID=UPI000CDDBDD2|nr:DUF1877 family protein [Streptomyces sp. Ru71]POX47637.1 DUF1877 domain-containing protein [Streptomyces sp. Ru71]
MALSQQFARVSPEYLERCRQSALDSPGAAPGWDPPASDRLDTGWASWGLAAYCRSGGADPAVAGLLDRAVSATYGQTAGYLDHDEVYDGFTDPPRVLDPAEVEKIARDLGDVDVAALLAELPDAPAEAAAACGHAEGFSGDVRAHLSEHFTALREFYAGAARRGQCVVVWID